MEKITPPGVPFAACNQGRHTDDGTGRENGEVEEEKKNQEAVKLSICNVNVCQGSGRQGENVDV